MSDLVNVAVFGTPVEAELARLYLENEGIHAIVAGATAFGYEGGAPRLMVLEDELDQARELLRDYIAKEDGRSARGPLRRG